MQNQQKDSDMQPKQNGDMQQQTDRNSTDKDVQKTVTPSTEDDRDSKRDMLDDESMMDFGSGSGGGSGGDGAAS